MPHDLVDGDTHEVAAGAGANTVETVFDPPDQYGYRMTDLLISYPADATTRTVVELHDAPDGTASGDLDADTRRFEDELDPAGERIQLTGWNFRDFEEDVLVLIDGNQDAQYWITVGGELLTGALPEST